MPEFDGLAISVGRKVARRRWPFRDRRPTCAAGWSASGRRRGRVVMSDHGLDLAVIGNGRTAALLEPTGRLVWWCYPRFDGDPVFCRLLAGDEEKGFSDVVLDGMVVLPVGISAQHRDREHGADRQPGRRGPHHRLRAALSQLRPHVPAAATDPHHRAAVGPAAHHHPHASDAQLRRADHAALARQQSHPLLGRRHRHPAHHRRAAVLHRPRSAVRAHPPDQHGARHRRAVRRASSPSLCREFCDRTRDYWMDWVRRLSISYDWQEPIIRAAITLKLSNFEETGGIIAAHTTSIPEAPGSGRTWDYRYCWLRDAYFVVKALNRIGATQTMEDFISFILGIAANNKRGAAAGLQHRADRSDGGAHRAASQGLSRRRAGADRQRRGPAGSARHLRQHHSRGDADVLRSPAAAARRRGAVPAAGDARREGRSSWRWSRMPASGNFAAAARSTPIRRRCAGPASIGSRAIAARLNFADRAAYWNADADKLHAHAAGAGLESEAEGVHRGARHRRRRRQRAAAARDSA